MDSKTTIRDIKDAVQAFCEDRDWDQFHNPKDLVIGVLTEAAELLEQFRFLSEEESVGLLEDPAKREKIEHEVADVAIFLLRFAQRFDIDVADAIGRKLKKNAERYPVEKARGSNRRAADL